MKSITIKGHLRTETGKKATRQVRSQGQVPCVIYGGKEEVAFSVPKLDLKGLVYTPEFQIADININNKQYKCILKDLQFNKVSDELSHIDFLELVDDKPVIATIPLKFTGTAAGVKAGGKLVTKIKSVKVKSLPKNLKENIEVDLTTLELNANIRIEDIKSSGMDILNSPRIPVATIVMTRQLKQEEAAATPAKGKK
jgi:large subunit ribosomal protein L25